VRFFRVLEMGPFAPLEDDVDQLFSYLPHLGENWAPAPASPAPGPQAPSVAAAPPTMASGRGSPSAFGDLFGGLFDDEEHAAAPVGGIRINPPGPGQKPGNGGGAGGGSGGGTGGGGGGSAGGGGSGGGRPAPGRPGYKPDGWEDPKPKPPVHFFGAPEEDPLATQGIGELGTLGIVLLLIGAPELAPVLLL